MLTDTDPAWLGEAIERAHQAATEHGTVEDSIRAALPTITAGVLRDEAEALLAEVRLQSSWLWYELGESALEKLAKRLFERAARQVDGNG